MTLHGRRDGVAARVGGIGRVHLVAGRRGIDVDVADRREDRIHAGQVADSNAVGRVVHRLVRDRKSTRLNSSHSQISYAVFCLKKKNKAPYRTCDSSYTTTRTSPRRP